MEMQILDVDYILVNERPVIRIFGKTREGKSVCGFYEGFLPYFYVRGEKGAEIMKGKAMRREKVKRNVIADNKKVELYKITTTHPAKTPEYRELLQKEGLEVFEADILFKYRFMNDCGLGGLGWIQVDGREVATNTVAVSRVVQIKKMSLVEREDAPFTILAFDIECVSLREGAAPDARKDPIIMISLAFSSPHKGRETAVLSTRGGKGVEVFDSEKSLLEGFIERVNEYDPDILTGFNCNNFDVPYILERMRQQGVRPLFGRCKTKGVFAKKLGARHKIGIAGRVMVDSFEVVKKDFSLQRYGLDFVAKALLKKEKENVKHSEIGRLWRGGSKEYERLVEYSRQDAVLALDLIVGLNVLDKYVALSKIAGTLLQDTLEGGETVRIENFLLRGFNKEGYVFPCKPSPRLVGEREKIKKKELVGGYVIEPEKNLHSNVVVLDFVSMYPSIIRTFNICPTTLVKEGGVQSPSGARFLPKGERQGIVPRILERLMDERQRVKKRMKRADPEKKRILYAKQWALKILANAFYGHFGYSRARMYDLSVANAITSWGRGFIGKTAQEIEELGYRVVYGDTDSVFVVIPNDGLETIAEKARQITARVTKNLPGIMTLEFEKVFKRFLPLTKKRYVAWRFVPADKGWEEGMEMKGIETVRRDWCGLVGESMEEVIDILLKREDVKGAVKYFKEIVQNLVEGNIPIQKLVITKTMTKSTKSYVGIQPHIELVKKIQARSPEEAPGIGDRVPFVIVKGTELLSKRAEDPLYVMERGLEIDSHYYIENQLLPPLERIFSALQVSKSELLGNGKQIGILDALRNHAKKQEAPSLTAADVKGFVCEKCSSFYPRVPLLGVCPCGGKLLFSSKKGQAEVITVN